MFTSSTGQLILKDLVGFNNNPVKTEIDGKKNFS
jgi:hypothetical protein